MQVTSLGTFVSDGKLYVGDPCLKTDSPYLLKVDVLPGTYSAQVTECRLKVPLFAWDECEHNRRVSGLCITHIDYKDLVFRETTESISVDSGQAGFFIQSTYDTPSPVPIPQIGYDHSFLSESLTSALISIKASTEALTQGDSNELFARMRKHFKDEAKTREYFQREILYKQDELPELQEHLRDGTTPNYLRGKHTNQFYEIMCDLTRRTHNAGLLPRYGVVSQTGIGDGGYQLFVAKNAEGHIVGAFLQFLNNEDIQ